MSQNIKARECKFAIYMPPKGESKDDHVFIKETHHMEDGTLVPSFRISKNLKRKYWITKKAFQNHQQKKEWESLDRVNEYECTQANLANSISRSLGRGPTKLGVRQICNSPYVYGADISITALVKNAYKQKYPDAMSGNTLMVFDTETDMVKGNDEIIIATISMEGYVFTAVRRDILKQLGTDEYIYSKLNDITRKYLTGLDEYKDYQDHTMICDTEIDMLIECFKRIHEKKPDFLGIWGVGFDIQRVIEACQRADYPPEQLFSEPSLPDELKFFKFKNGKENKVSRKGNNRPLGPADRWSTVETPATYYVLDLMSAYKQIRTGEPNLPTYRLDYVLNKEKIGLKFKLDAVAHLENDKKQWFRTMQTRYPLEYILYNKFDCIRVEELDKKTTDASIQLSTLAGVSDYIHFPSQPRRWVDQSHFGLLECGYVIGTTGSDMVDDYDEETIGLDGHIVTLSALRISENGLKLIAERPDLPTRLYSHVFDIDVEGAYPNNQISGNVSKTTTMKEIINIEGIDESVMRLQGLNLSGGPTNAVEFVTAMYKFPTLMTLLERFDEVHSS